MKFKELVSEIENLFIVYDIEPHKKLEELTTDDIVNNKAFISEVRNKLDTIDKINIETN